MDRNKKIKFTAKTGSVIKLSAEARIYDGDNEMSVACILNNNVHTVPFVTMPQDFLDELAAEEAARTMHRVTSVMERVEMQDEPTSVKTAVRVTQPKQKAKKSAKDKSKGKAKIKPKPQEDFHPDDVPSSIAHRARKLADSHMGSRMSPTKALYLSPKDLKVELNKETSTQKLMEIYQMVRGKPEYRKLVKARILEIDSDFRMI